MALTTAENVKGYLGQTPTGVDPLIDRLVVAASDWFERQVGRQLATATYTETHIGDGYPYIVPRQCPISAVASITVDGGAVTASTGRDAAGWYLLNGVVYFRQYYLGNGSVIVIQYTAGYAAGDVPADIEQAVIEMVAMKYREKSHVGSSSVSMAGTSVSFLPSLIPLSVKEVIEGYRRVTT